MGRPRAEEHREARCYRIRPSVADRLERASRDRAAGKGLLVERALIEYLDRLDREGSPTR